MIFQKFRHRIVILLKFAHHQNLYLFLNRGRSLASGQENFLCNAWKQSSLAGYFQKSLPYHRPGEHQDPELKFSRLSFSFISFAAVIERSLSKNRKHN